MRINCVIGPFLPVPPVMGGAVERIFQSLCEEFAARGHQVTLISREHPGFAARETRNGVEYLRIASFDAPASRPLYRLYDLVYALRANRALPPADVTITHSVALPLVISRRRAGKLCVSVGRFPKGQMWLYRRADRLQAVSTAVADEIRRQSPSVAPITRVLPNCLDTLFADGIGRARGPRRKEILFVGRIAREKGIDQLIRGFAQVAARHPDWRLVVLGPHSAREGGDGEGFLDELKHRAGDVRDRVAFAGPVYDKAALIARFRQAEIFVYPSLAAQGESFGLAPLEAMACGCATIVSSLDCFGDFLTHGHDGLRYDHADASGTALAEALETLMESAAMRESLAANAAESCARFAPGAVAEQFLRDFEALAA